MNKIANIFQVVVFFPIFIVLKTFYGFEVRGRDNLKGLSPKDAAIYAANHCGPFDGVITAVAIAMPWNGFRLGAFLPIRYLAFEDYFSWVKFDGPFPFPISFFVASWLRLSACIPVKSRRKDQIGKVFVEDVLSFAIQALKNGERIFIFPEGKMNKNNKLQKAKRGVACLHKESGAPIVPIHISGTFRMLQKRQKVVVTFGKPMNFTIRNDQALSDMAVVANNVMKEISQLAKK
ncbi:MAG: hypothetical protein CR972_01695 [Candidatus Moraniibacteriota bacterium]|nr:MAG: hypothetical protein CR972_01695 [Candidatus Moranbacteria bacterium]